MRFAAVAVVLLGLGACAPECTDTGVGFDSYQSYAADRDAQLRGLPPPSTLPQGGVPPATGFDPARVGAAIDAAEQGTALPPAGAPAPLSPATGTGAMVGGSASLDANRPRGNAPAGIAETTSEMTGVGSPAISDEQDFNAVSQRETIESDKERIARNARAIPGGAADSPAAARGRHPARAGGIRAWTPRTPWASRCFRRSGIRLNSYEAACKRYRSPDLAQEAFLNSGGPKRDPQGAGPGRRRLRLRLGPAPVPRRAAIGQWRA